MGTSTERSNWQDDLAGVLTDWRADGRGAVVLSPDVDGLATCALLALENDVNVIGIYTTTKLLLLDGATTSDAKKALWLDHDVSQPGVRCVGQHLIHLTPNDTLPRRESMSFNPNGWVKQSWDQSFKGRAGRKRDKYPYGTCHMIASLYGFDPGANASPEAALLAHADGTWRTVVDYQANADIWYDLMFQGETFLKFLRDTWHNDPSCLSVHQETMQVLIDAGVSPSASRATIARLLPDNLKALTGNQGIRYTAKNPQAYAQRIRDVLSVCASIVGTTPTMVADVTDIIDGAVESVYPNRVGDFDQLMLDEGIFSHAFTDFRTLRYTTGISL